MVREISGEGCVVEASLFSAVSDWMTVPLLHYEADGVGPKRVGLAHPTIHPYGVFDTADGAPLLIAIQNEREFATLCSIVLQDATIPDDPRFATNVERVKHEPEFDAVINNVFGSTPRAELRRRLDEAKVAYGDVNDCGGLQTHPSLRRVTVDSEVGPVSTVAPAARFNGQERSFGPVRHVSAFLVVCCPCCSFSSSSSSSSSSSKCSLRLLGRCHRLARTRTVLRRSLLD